MLTYSQPLPLGSPCPAFLLPSVEGKRYTLSDFKESKTLLVTFICAHCPYVLAIEDRLINLSRRYSQKDLQVVAICSNDASHYSEDAPEALLKRWAQKEYGFPYLIDETQQTAKDFQVCCTPEFYLFDADRNLYYHGQLDNFWKDAAKVTKEAL